jgi:7-cyano-7-deazaguanine synthase
MKEYARVNLPNKRRVLLLLSGGFDSSVLLCALLERENHVEALLVDYGQRHKIELSYARRLCTKHGVEFHDRTLTLPHNNALTNVDEPMNGKEQEHDFVVPFRNMMLLALACSVAQDKGLGVVAIGCNLDDASTFTDCRPNFIEHMSHAAGLCAGISIIAPFTALAKREIVTRCANLLTKHKVEPDDCYSCYSGRQPCGWCPACVKMTAIVGQLV